MHDSSIIDLHCHSTASDGTYAPKEVAALAQKIGLSAIALTDHDTIDGLAEFQAAGNALGIEAIAGIEFAALWEHFHRPEIHIVGLGFDPAHPFSRAAWKPSEAAAISATAGCAKGFPPSVCI